MIKTSAYTQINGLMAEQEKKKIINTSARKEAENVSEEEKGASLQISEEAREKYHMLSMLQHEAEKIREQNEAAKEHADDIAKIMTIFRRIANGDIVPGSDEKKLMEHSMELYQAAKMAAALAKNEDPEEYKSVDEGEESETQKMVREALERIGSGGDKVVLKEGAPVEAAEAPVAE